MDNTLIMQGNLTFYRKCMRNVTIFRSRLYEKEPWPEVQSFTLLWISFMDTDSSSYGGWMERVLCLSSVQALSDDKDRLGE